MDCEYLEKISLLIDDRISLSEAEGLRTHIDNCQECRRTEKSFLVLRQQIRSLPTIRDKVTERNVLQKILSKRSAGRKKNHRKSAFQQQRVVAAAVLLITLIGAGGIFLYNPWAQKSWDVTNLEGNPTINSTFLAGNGRLKVGEWLETNESSRAKVTVAEIGSVEVDPETRIRLVETNSTEHRLELERGSIAAQIDAPPRLFFVNTPSATVIDYGCAYTLNVSENGESVLHVTEGWVSLAMNGRESLVPASAYAKSRVGVGPGTPYFEDASGEFVVALTNFDFENGGAAALDVLIAQSRERDALSLWYLLERSQGAADRTRIFNRLATLVPVPHDATREGILSLDRRMLDAWKETIDIVSIGDRFVEKNQGTNNSGKLVSIGNMTVPRAGHTATRLHDGKILIAGGLQKTGIASATAEIFDPQTKLFLPTASMSVTRVGHTATLLPSGNVLIVGGEDSSGKPHSSTEVFNTEKGGFVTGSSISAARSNHQATLLNDGKVLISGGTGSHNSALDIAEIYDTERRAFLGVGKMTAPRRFHTATLLNDGNVLITGGNTGGESATQEALSSAEIYDPLTRSFATTGRMNEKRYGHSASILADGRVLVAGGSGGREWKDRRRSAEVYDPQQKGFSRTKEMSLPRFNHPAATLLLSDNRILVAGGGARLEIYDPRTDFFDSTTGNVGTGRIFSTATLLLDGEILIAGGYNFVYPPTATAWLYEP